MTTRTRWKRRTIALVVVVALLAIPVAGLVWYKLLREVPQPARIASNPELNFLYGSIGSEARGGIPYWIVVVLPRVFGTDYLPGPGGYAALGLSWQEGTELPVGFSKKTIGVERVGFNCALCHAAQYRTTEHETPKIVAAGGSQTADIQGLLDFFSKSASDARFNADTILTEIDLAYQLSWIDRLLYRYILIPSAKTRLKEISRQFGWAHATFVPGSTRDGASTSLSRVPSLWHLDTRAQSGRVWPEHDETLDVDFTQAGIDQSRLMLMNLAGGATSVRSMVVDSAVELGSRNSAPVLRRVDELDRWLRQVPAPRFPVPISAEEAALAAAGQSIFEQQCARCHAAGRDNRLGTVIPLDEVGTDPARTNAWTREAASSINKTVAALGFQRTPLVAPPRPGYVTLQLDGLWLRGPYLHNGSVPTVRDLLEPPLCRPKIFYRGYDVLDVDNLGFVTRRCDEAPAHAPAGCELLVQSACVPSDQGRRFDTSEAGNGSGGHEFGTRLAAGDKRRLIAFLKTF